MTGVKKKGGGGIWAQSQEGTEGRLYEKTECQAKMEADIRIILQAKECLVLPEARRGQERSSPTDFNVNIVLWHFHLELLAS